MEKNKDWKRISYIIGVVALIGGALDPMEGSVVIALGSLLLALSSWFSKDRHAYIFVITSCVIITGVFFLFFLSSLGGFGGKSELSIWLGLLILPYPVGWIVNIVLILVRAFKKAK